MVFDGQMTAWPSEQFHTYCAKFKSWHRIHAELLSASGAKTGLYRVCGLRLCQICTVCLWALKTPSLG